MSAAGLMQTFQTNVAGPAQVTQAMLLLVERGDRKVVVNISSTAGTFGKDLGPIVASYSVTKAALNMLVCTPPSICDIHLTEAHLLRVVPDTQASKRKA